MSFIINILDWLNKYQGLAQWLLLIAAILTGWYAIKEFLLKKRPYIALELAYSKSREKWVFFLKMLNKGDYPGIVKISDCELRIGDENYPSHFTNELVIFPGESKASPHIGTINQIGINKIRGHEYMNNRAEIEVKVISREIEKKKYKYETKTLIQIDVSSDEPSFKLIEEKFS